MHLFFNVVRCLLNRQVNLKSTISDRKTMLFGVTRFFCSKSGTNSKFESSEDSELKEGKSEAKHLLDDAATFELKDPPGDEWSSPVYPKLTTRSQARHSVRPQVDPKTTSVLLFPGQGVQYVGMNKDLLKYGPVKQMFQSASEIMRYNLLDLCINGPKDMLNDTANCQVAVMVSSLAAVEKLRHDAPVMIENCVTAAGFSVGEYTALVFAGALTFEDGVRLLKIRGEAMQAASELCPSGMMTAMLRPDAKVKYACAAAKEWCTRQTINNPDCCIAIYLYPECKVLAGNMEALNFIELNAADFGIKKIKYLNVSGAFHSKLMKPAKEVLEKALKAVDLVVPLIPVHSNVDGKPYTTVDQIRTKLVEQLCNPVKWEQTMHVIFERPEGTDFPNVYECGPGKSLKTILRQNNVKAHAQCECIEA